MSDTLVRLDVCSAAFTEIMKICKEDKGFATVDHEELARHVSETLAQEARNGILDRDELTKVVIGRLRQEEQVRRSRSNLGRLANN